MLFLSTSPEYPDLLKKIKDPPPILYNRGNLGKAGLSLAFVGSRKMSVYGAQCLELILGGLAAYDVCIISGLAYGVDAHAHQTALKLELTTIAVLGSGINPENIYPRGNAALAEQIIANHGAIVSEFPENSKIYKKNFIMRNRVIAGMSDAVIVIEADEKSGALTTANFSFKNSRPVFAVPGSIFNENSRGTNSLIKKGANLLTGAEDIIARFKPAKTRERIKGPDSLESLSINEQKVYKFISKESTPFEEIMSACGLPVSETSVALISLELHGKIRAVGLNCYVRNLTTIK